MIEGPDRTSNESPGAAWYLLQRRVPQLLQKNTWCGLPLPAVSMNDLGRL
jgi:hypothetical protein